MTTAAATDYRTNLLVQADMLQSAGDPSMDRVSANLLGLGGQEPSMGKKPRVTAQADGTFLVTFGHGGRAEVIEHVDGGWDVSEFVSGRYGRSQCPSTEIAIEAAAKLTFVPEVFATWGDATDVQALALECNSDRAKFVKTIKRIAKERFGVKLSVRGDTGTAYGWVRVKPAKSGDRAGHALETGLDRCNRCKAPAFVSKAGNLVCAAICWERNITPVVAVAEPREPEPRAIARPTITVMNGRRPRGAPAAVDW